jgi:hypothetical protein
MKPYCCLIMYLILRRGCRCDRMVVGLQLPIQSVFITTDVSSTTKLDNIFATGGNNIVEKYVSLNIFY